MNRFVLDASVALKWVLPEIDSPKALQIQADYSKQIVELLAPDLFPIEVAHALAKAERRNIIASPLGSQYLTDILQSCPQLEPSMALLPRAFEIATNARIGVYDCLYVCLAERENIPLITADQKLVKTLSKDFPFIVDLDSLP
jgi:predicted nucleic acid-binding protein